MDPLLQIPLFRTIIKKVYKEPAENLSFPCYNPGLSPGWVQGPLPRSLANGQKIDCLLPVCRWCCRWKKDNKSSVPVMITMGWIFLWSGTSQLWVISLKEEKRRYFSEVSNHGKGSLIMMSARHWRSITRLNKDKCLPSKIKKILLYSSCEADTGEDMKLLNKEMSCSFPKILQASTEKKAFTLIKGGGIPFKDYSSCRQGSFP